MEFERANDVQKQVKLITAQLKLDYINPQQIFCFRSQGSSSRAIARIWSLPRVWQLALNLPASYVIEVISERFDRLNQEEQTKVLIHEILHIPQTFSGALRPHKTGTFVLNQRTVNKFYRLLKKC